MSSLGPRESEKYSGQDVCNQRISKINLSVCTLMSPKTAEPTDGGEIPSPFLQSTIVSAKGVNTKNWEAWLTILPPPHQLHVVGDVQVGNPGVDPILIEHEPQLDPCVLQLDLFLIQQPGIWPDIVVWKQTRYTKIGRKLGYEFVEIRYEDKPVAKIEVEKAE